MMNRPAKFTAQALKLNLAKSSGYFLSVALFGLDFGSAVAYALDSTRTPVNTAPTIARGTPYSAMLREWFHARKLGDIEAAWKFLEDAARDGNVGAASELGRFCADGDGVELNHQLAFEYFIGIADSHADELTDTAERALRRQLRCEARRLLSDGHPYLQGKWPMTLRKHICSWTGGLRKGR
jgi:TPR repeat protein